MLRLRRLPNWAVHCVTVALLLVVIGIELLLSNHPMRVLEKLSPGLVVAYIIGRIDLFGERRGGKN